MLTQSQLDQIKTQANVSTVLLTLTIAVLLTFVWYGAGISFGAFLFFALIAMTVSSALYAYGQKMINDNIEYFEHLNNSYL